MPVSSKNTREREKRERGREREKEKKRVRERVTKGGWKGTERKSSIGALKQPESECPPGRELLGLKMLSL